MCEHASAAIGPNTAECPWTMVCCSVEFGTIMLWFYVADRSTLLFPVEKEYLRDR